MARFRSRRRRATVVGLLSSLLLGGLIALVTLLMGKVEGTEFAPSHFTSRTFSFWELPLVHLQLSPIHRAPLTTPVTNHLRSQQLIQVPKAAATDWHLVQIERGISTPTPADAEILIGYLELEDASGPIWEQWSKDHPAAAGVLWPVVQRLANREFYILLPELFELASRHSEPAALTAEIDRYLRGAYLQLAADLQAADHPRLAAAVLRDAEKDFPGDPQIAAMREGWGERFLAPSPPNSQRPKAD